MYGSLKGHLSLTWKICVCFVENRSLFSKNWIGKSKFALKNGSLFSEMGVRIKEFAFESGSMFWKMEVCFWESEFENGSLFSKIGVENQNLLSKIREFDVGACSARVAWALVPDCTEGSMFRHWRNGGQCWSNDDKKTTFLNLTQNQVKDLQETLCKRRKKRRKAERGTTCPPLTKNTNQRITKEIRTENAATVKHFQKKK